MKTLLQQQYKESLTSITSIIEQEKKKGNKEINTIERSMKQLLQKVN